MQRDRLVTALLAALLVVGLGIAAGAFESATFSTSGEAEPVPTDVEGGQPPSIVTYFGVFLILTVYFGLAGVMVGFLYGDVTPRQARDFGIGLAILGTGVLFLVDPQTAFSTWIEEIMQVRPDGLFGSAGGAGESAGNGSGAAAGTGGILGVSPVVVFGGLVAVLLGGLVVAMQFSGGSPVAREPADEPGHGGGDSTTVGEAAGRAAERIEETTLSNGVYQAWHEMTAAVDVADPETTTPAEFADAAIAAGVDEADARALTELFREVRYGDAIATAERERRAVETLRRIEAAYADRGEGP